MFSLEKKSTQIPNVYLLRFNRYMDERGYFAETARLSELREEVPQIDKIVQVNESYNKEQTIRGLHFQWEPYMGKLVRPLQGTVYEIVLDIRKGSPTLGKALIIELAHLKHERADTWLWVPPGMAHGFFCKKECTIEYLTTGEYSGETEANISPLAKDIDWSLNTEDQIKLFKETVRKAKITKKDREGPHVREWLAEKDSDYFIYNKT